MARDPHTSDTVHLEIVGRPERHAKRRGSGDAENAVSDPATARVAPEADLNAQEIIDECKRLLQGALREIDVLTERNAGLQAELILLAQKEAQARHLAYHDELTGLPNRSLLQDRFRQAMSRADRHHKPLALLMVDLDEFKRVNDELGHASGDRLLQAVARRLAQSIRGADTACRYGGDEFVIMLPDADTPKVATTLAVEIGQCLGEPYVIDGHRIDMAVSIGVAVYPGDGQTFDDLMKQADVAMYRTKGAGCGTTITEQSVDDTRETSWRRAPAPTGAERSKRL